ncbi:hypothetical protein AURDEDRAFT_164662 [Auricularia subglabra TFB-10046 SS5]|nr:hypothetical protein AURDEDRAFT_164662 [Auricularia subglabra TFB-10046 SS5]
MRFSASTFLVAAALAAIPVHAFTAWSGGACNGGQGADAACNGGCGDFRDRHSFKAGSGTHCVALYAGTNCGGQRFNFTGQSQQCTNVNTGTNIQSYRCYAGAGCS